MWNMLKKRLAYARLKNRMLDEKPIATLPASEPPEWFKNIYADYLNSEEGRRLYSKPRET